MDPRLYKRTARACRLLLVACASAACGEAASDVLAPSGPGGPPPPAAPDPNPPGPVPDNSPIGLRVSPGGTIDPGEVLQLQATLIAADSSESVLSSASWSSSDPAVVSVASDGTVTGVGSGVTHVVGRSGDLADSARVVVRLYLSMISVGDMHTCGVTAVGSALCWGGNSHGELGTGDYDHRPQPSRSAHGYRFRSIAAAGGFTCAVATDDRGYCWGDDSMMELGESLAGKTSSVPMAIAGGLSLQSVSGSQMAHACGLSTDGSAWCWGYNRFGMVGHGILRDEPEPVAVVGGLSFTDLHSSYFRTCAVEASGSVYCWGHGGPTQIGDPAAAMDTCDGLDCALAPMQAASPEAFSQVSVSATHSCAVTRDADVYCWGSNDAGQLGIGGYQDGAVPTRVGLAAAAMTVVTGRVHSCALLVDGTAHCWGDNTQGQLGSGAWSSTDLPQPVTGGLQFQYLSAGFHQTCALTDSGKAYCWGRNAERQLGVGDDPAYAAPTSVRLD